MPGMLDGQGRARSRARARDSGARTRSTFAEPGRAGRRERLRVRPARTNPGARPSSTRSGPPGARPSRTRGDVADWDDAEAMVRRAIDALGQLDMLVNNAGFLRDRMIFNMSEEDLDTVVRVHLKGHFCPTRHAAGHWRDLSKAADGPVYGRIINTAPRPGCSARSGQPNYAAAKARDHPAHHEHGGGDGPPRRHRERHRAARPHADDREQLGGFAREGRRLRGVRAEHVAPLVAYLASPDAARVSGQLFVVWGRQIGVLDGPFVERAGEHRRPLDAREREHCAHAALREPRAGQGRLHAPALTMAAIEPLPRRHPPGRPRRPARAARPHALPRADPRRRAGTTAPSSGTCASSSRTGGTRTTGARTRRA